MKAITQKKAKDKLHSNKLLQLINEQEMTQQELSDITGIGKTHLTKIIKGQRRCISLPIAINIARALNKPIEEIFIYRKEEDKASVNK